MGCNEVKFDENEYSGGGGNMRKDIATLALAAGNYALPKPTTRNYNFSSIAEFASYCCYF